MAGSEKIQQPKDSLPEKPVRLLLVCQRPEAVVHYREAASQVMAVLDQVGSFRNMFQIMCSTPYNGILVDLHTKLRAPKEETQLLTSLMDRFPVVQLSVDSASNSIRACHYGQMTSCDTLETFITQECTLFKARTIRSSERFSANLNVLLTHDGDAFEITKAQRTATLNLSQGGCFIVTADNFRKSESVWIAFHDFPEDIPVRGVVRWHVPWGVRREIPGIGLKFVGMDTARAKALLQLI